MSTAPSIDNSPSGTLGLSVPSDSKLSPLVPRTEHGPHQYRIALVGNPNAGKTTLFNALTGLRQRTGNYPGVTVEKKVGRWTGPGFDAELIDLPGTYSLAARSPDELVAVDVLLGRAGDPPPDAVVAIVDASNLERHLYLLTQLLELGLPVVVALNMIDVARQQGITIDAEQLAIGLGVPVVAIQANRGHNLGQLIPAILAAEPPAHRVSFPSVFEREVKQLAERHPDTPPFLLRRLLIDAGGSLEQRVEPEMLAELTAARQRLLDAGCVPTPVEAKARYAWIRTITRSAVARRPEAAARHDAQTDRLDRLLTHRVWGTLVFLAIMFVVFQSIFTAAAPLMDLILEAKAALVAALREPLPPGPLTSLLLDGVIEGVGSVVVFLPQILILFGFLAILEDCGYLARAAFLMDKVMSRCGLSGKAFIPMLSSVACAIPGVMSTRVIEDPRDRLTTILVAPLMSCSARLPVYSLMIGAFFRENHAWWVPGLTLFAMYLIGFVTAPLVALALKRTVLRGGRSVFVMEMPQYQWPNWRTVLLRMYDRAGAFLYRAGTLILASMVVVWALLYFPAHDADGVSYESRLVEARQAGLPEAEIARVNGEWKRQSYLGRAGRWIEPVVRPLGWDWKVGTAVLASFPAREVVVGVLGVIYNRGDVADEEGERQLTEALREARWDGEPNRPVFGIPVALSVMVFFALCCQCASTLAVIHRETGTWKWPAFTFAYMTLLAYVAAFATYQIAARLSA